MFFYKQLLIALCLLFAGCSSSTQLITPLDLKDKEYDFMGTWVSDACVQIEGRELLWKKMHYEFTTEGELKIQAKHYLEGQCTIPKLYAGNGGPPPKSFVILEELMVDKGLFSKGVPGSRLRVYFGPPQSPLDDGVPAGVDVLVVVIDKKKLCASDGITFGDTGYGASTRAAPFINFENCVYRSDPG